jgi:CheY-like chemotaxis protein
MSPVDGGTLLRWVRRHKDSPDPFLPFFMISGYSDEARVRAARDLGVTEFIAKPFRIHDIITHVEATVHDQRKFVKTPDYFGPDRRRQFVLVGEERRGKAEHLATFLDAPRRLYTKVGGQLSLDLELIENAQQQVDDLHQDFADWVQEDLRQLDRAFTGMVTSQYQGTRTSALETMCRICHELRGQGGVFGYPLVTDVAESLFKLSNNMTALPGDGGALGQELMRSLKVANLNFINKPENKRMVNREFAKLAEGARTLPQVATG